MKTLSLLTIAFLLTLGGCARRHYVHAAYGQPQMVQTYAVARSAPAVTVTAPASQFSSPNTAQQAAPGVVVRARVTVVPSAPPAAPAVVAQRPVAPRVGSVWVQGHWQWDGQQYGWAPGRYIDSVPGRVYVQPNWQRRPAGWAYTHGHWVSGHHGYGRGYGHGYDYGHGGGHGYGHGGGHGGHGYGH